MTLRARLKASRVSTASTIRLLASPRTVGSSASRRCSTSARRAALEEADDLAVFIKIDTRGRRHLRQSRHRHDVAAEHDDELRAGGESHLADIDGVPEWRAAQLRIGREGILRLGDADRVV